MQNDSVTIKVHDLIYRAWLLTGLVMFFWVWQYALVWFISAGWGAMVVIAFCRSKGIDFNELFEREKKEKGTNGKS